MVLPEFRGGILSPIFIRGSWGRLNVRISALPRQDLFSQTSFENLGATIDFNDGNLYSNRNGEHVLLIEKSPGHFPLDVGGPDSSKRRKRS